MGDSSYARQRRSSGRSDLLAILIGAAIVAAPCLAAVAPARVGVSIPPQLWLVEQIGVGRVEASSLLSPGDSPATFQPSDAQITDLLRSQLFFRIGVPFELGGWLDAIARSRRVRVVDTREGVELRPIDSYGVKSHRHRSDSGLRDSQEGFDPHIWLSPRRLQTQAETMAHWLQQIDPDSLDLYRDSLSKLLNRLDELDRDLTRRLAPYRGRAFMTFHPSWGYFAADYGLRQLAIEVGGKDPSDNELTGLQQLAREQGIRVIYVQPQIQSRAVQAVADAIGAKAVEIDPLIPDVIANLNRVTDLLVSGFEAGAEP